MATFNTQKFIDNATKAGYSEDQISSFLQSKGIDYNKPTQEISKGKINFWERLKLSFGGAEAKAKQQALEKQAGLKGKFDIGDIADVAGAIPGLAGFALGSGAGIVGGGVGAAAGEAVKEGIGKALGVREKFDPKKIVTEGAMGIAAGGIAKGISAGLKGLTNALPKRLVQSALKQSPKEIMAGKDMSDFVLNKARIGTTNQLYKESIGAVKSISNQIDDAVKLASGKISKNSVFNAVIKNPYNQYANLTKKQLNSILTQSVPQAKKLIAKETLKIQEANALRKLIDASLGDRFFLTNQPQFTKDILNDIARTLSEIVKTKAPLGTRELFNELSKEITLRKVLDSLIAKKTGKELITMSDILAGAGVGIAASPIAGLGAIGARRLASSSGAKIAAGVGLKKAGQALASPVVQGAGKAAKLGLFELLSKSNR